MVKVTDKDFYIDGYLQQNLDFAIQAVRKDDDWLLIVDGRERSGKSVLAQQIGYYVDNTLNLERITFSVKDWEEKINNAKPYSCVIWDEAYEGLSKRSFISKINRKVVNILMKCGQKNLFMILVMPTFFELDKYAVLHRAKGLLHIHRGKKYDRGYFRYYNASGMKRMYLEGAKKYQYNNKFSSFIGRFTNFYTINEEEYRTKKAKDLERREEEETITKQAKQRNILIQFINKKYYNNLSKLNREIVAEYPTFELSDRQMRAIVKEWSADDGLF